MIQRSLSVLELLEAFKDKKISSFEVVKSHLENIKALNADYNAILFLRPEEDLLTEAKRADTERESGSTKKLLGVPFVVKDSFMAINTPTTGGDLYLKDTFSEYNATVIQKLLDEGAVLLGKTNMDAWGFGGSTENSSYGVTRNPFDKSRVAGGSSGGSAAALALNMCAFAIGEDTGGSTRQPASYCGIYGLKPTYGRISRFGCIAYASSLDSIGIFGRTPEDLDLIFSIIATPDDHDMTLENSSQSSISSDHKRKFAYSEDFTPEGLNPEIRDAYLRTIDNFKTSRYEAVKVEFSAFKYCIPTYYVTAMAEASTNLSRYNGTRYGNLYNRTEQGNGNETQFTSWEELFTYARSTGFNKEAKRRVFLGSFISSEGYNDAYYKKAQKIRNLLLNQINEVLEEVDFILSPVAPNPAPKIGEVTNDPVKAYLEDIYTVTANLAGIPSIAFPVGETDSSLPIGMQVMGGKFSDEKLIQILKEIKK